MYKECQCLIPNDDFSPHLDKASYLSIRVVFFGSCRLILSQNVAPRKSLPAKYAVFSVQCGKIYTRQKLITHTGYALGGCHKS